MPPPPKGATNPTKTKKKKGPIPAHQNTFAFRHNPKSRTTEKILSSPNIHVCRRCHDKIEWRKQYRKYKPRTQPGVCNGCKRKNVLSAYHTICTQCTTDSVAAKKLIQDEMNGISLSTDDVEEATVPDVGSDEGVALVETRKDNDIPLCSSLPILRACAVCVKVLALPDPEGDQKNELDEAMANLRLRERKTIERKLANEKYAARKGGVNNDDDDDADDDGREGGVQHNHGNNFAAEFSDTDSDDDEDPFLKAIGGADKLLVGEAYQQKLLQLQRQHDKE